MNQMQNSREFKQTADLMYGTLTLKSKKSSHKNTSNVDGNEFIKDFYTERNSQFAVEPFGSPLETFNLQNIWSLNASVYDMKNLEKDKDFVEEQIIAHKAFEERVTPSSDFKPDESVALYKKLEEMNRLEGTVDNPSISSKLIVHRMISVKVFLSGAYNHCNLDKPLWELEWNPNYPKHGSTNLSSSMGIREPLYTPIDGGNMISGYANVQNAQIPESLLFNSTMPSQMSKKDILRKILSERNVSKDELTVFVQSFGVSKELRAIVWQLMLGYLPCAKKNRSFVLKKNRMDYFTLLEEQMDLTVMSDQSIADLGVILLDSPRTHPTLYENLFSKECMRQSLERVLLTWSIVNGSSGYYQGLNDITSIFYVVFLQSALESLGDVSVIFDDDRYLNELEEALICIEPDVYYCLTSMMRSIENYHPFKTGGLYSESMIPLMEDLIKRKNYEIWDTITKANIPFFQILFRSTLCYFVRELSTSNVILLWDAYITENQGFSHFHIFVAAAFILQYAEDLKGLEFEDIIVFLFRMPTSHFTKHDIHRIVQSAYEIKLYYPLYI